MRHVRLARAAHLALVRRDRRFVRSPDQVLVDVWPMPLRLFDDLVDRVGSLVRGIAAARDALHDGRRREASQLRHGTADASTRHAQAHVGLPVAEGAPASISEYISSDITDDDSRAAGRRGVSEGRPGPRPLARRTAARAPSGASLSFEDRFPPPRTIHSGSMTRASTRTGQAVGQAERRDAADLHAGQLAHRIGGRERGLPDAHLAADDPVDVERRGGEQDADDVRRLGALRGHDDRVR